MVGFEERVYELGSAALAEQERHATELRTRGAAILAAGAVIASLLASPVFRHGHPSGSPQIASTIVGLTGCAGVLLFVVLLMRPSEIAFSVRAGATYRTLWEQGILEQPVVDLALADAFEERHEQNVAPVKRLVFYLSLALASLVIETAGLAAAAALTS